MLAAFQTEANDHLRGLDSLLRAWPAAPAEPGRDMVEQLFKIVHTLKGAARSVARQDIEGQCQKLETSLSNVLRQGVPADGVQLRQAIQRLRRSVHGGQPQEPGAGKIETRPENPPPSIHAAEAESSGSPTPQSEPLPVPQAAPQPAPAREAAVVEAAPATATTRANVAALDALLHGIEELLPYSQALDQQSAGLKATLDQIALQRQQLKTSDSADLSLERIDHDLRLIEAQLRHLHRNVAADLYRFDGSLNALGEQARALRLSSAWNVVEGLSVMLEDIAAEQGKRVNIDITGFDVMLDRRILEAIKDPLLHVCRNAIDHGVEPASERVAAGKPEVAKIAIRLSRHDERRFAIEISDDGRGINLGRLRESAARLHIESPDDLAAMPEDRVTALAFRAGLSTATVVTTLSGHGLGLAIVRDHVEALGGHVELVSEPGHGVTVRILVPTSVDTFRGLVVEAGGRRFLLPMDHLLAVVRNRGQLASSASLGQTLAWRGEHLPAAQLCDVLALPEETGSTPTERSSAVILQAGEQRGALLVDALGDEQSLLLQPLPSPLVRVPHVLAVAVTAHGDLLPVLRVADLLRALALAPTRRPERSLAKRREARKLLVVDDSITTRMMEQSLFEAAGYEVYLAADGIEALAMLRQMEIDIIISDVDMPNLNGFELTRQIRQEAPLAQKPVILVTALESREDKEEGLRAGANAYVAKSAFDQTHLLEIVQRLTLH
ncbi:hybrid sensor histidine kinase/response regulator [Ancylobacter pratisalsi]|uniref:Chemotaxis protein CheA n=1 Tax=Ancylobacter pratisalsi TaxID=1745854 RepID=A0A6P1YP82_9HYPH|nr:response regulator [Ancylobacter pratisalsi]QIB34541.1 response regulator [Ancylobacter pratisalsi]